MLNCFDLFVRFLLEKIAPISLFRVSGGFVKKIVAIKIFFVWLKNVEQLIAVVGAQNWEN